MSTHIGAAELSEFEAHGGAVQVTRGLQQPPVGVTLSDGSQHGYPASWARRGEDRQERGEHWYNVADTGELHVIHSWTITLYGDAATEPRIIHQESIAITYSAHAWKWVTGPNGSIPSDQDVQEFPLGAGEVPDAVLASATRDLLG